MRFSVQKVGISSGVPNFPAFDALSLSEMVSRDILMLLWLFIGLLHDNHTWVSFPSIFMGLLQSLIWFCASSSAKLQRYENLVGELQSCLDFRECQKCAFETGGIFNCIYWFVYLHCEKTVSSSLNTSYISCIAFVVLCSEHQLE